MELWEGINGWLFIWVKDTRLIIDKNFSIWVYSELVGRLLALFNRCLKLLNCLGLEAQDQDSKGKTKTMRVKTETKTVKILPRDEAVPRGFPSLMARRGNRKYIIT